MTAVFASDLASVRGSRGWLGVGWLWIKEVLGLLKFAVRERTGLLAIAAQPVGSPPGRRWNLGAELRWAWRGVDARGWRGAVAILASRAVAAQLFGISPTDLRTYAIVVTGVIAVALLATWLPARQAARVDPAIAVRSD